MFLFGYLGRFPVDLGEVRKFHFFFVAIVRELDHSSLLPVLDLDDLGSVLQTVLIVDCHHLLSHLPVMANVVTDSGSRYLQI